MSRDAYVGLLRWLAGCREGEEALVEMAGHLVCRDCVATGIVVCAMEEGHSLVDLGECWELLRSGMEVR
jgi:hypothetical protein